MAYSFHLVAMSSVSLHTSGIDNRNRPSKNINACLSPYLLLAHFHTLGHITDQLKERLVEETNVFFTMSNTGNECVVRCIAERKARVNLSKLLSCYIENKPNYSGSAYYKTDTCFCRVVDVGGGRKLNWKNGRKIVTETAAGTENQNDKGNALYKRVWAVYCW